MHLLTGFMRKEDKNPLRYITRGMVAMNLYGAVSSSAQTWLEGLGHPGHPFRPALLTLGRLRE